jgi:hypothetical protein
VAEATVVQELNAKYIVLARLDGYRASHSGRSSRGSPPGARDAKPPKTGAAIARWRCWSDGHLISAPATLNPITGDALLITDGTERAARLLAAQVGPRELPVELELVSEHTPRKKCGH